jgi:hypothetical protein
VVCVENVSLSPPFIASRGRFRDYIWKEPAMEGSPGDDTWQLEARGVEGGCGSTRVAPPAIVLCMLVACWLHVGPRLCLRGWLAHIFLVE